MPKSLPVEEDKKLLMECKVCGNELHEGEHDGLHVLQSIVGHSGGGYITSTIPVWACPGCGVIHKMPPGLKLIPDRSLITF